MAELTLEDSDEEGDSHEVDDKSLAPYANLIKMDESKPDSADGSSTSAQLQATTHSYKGYKRRKARKARKWADKCMYAELLEMNPMSAEAGLPDGLPDDLQTAWIAVSPVPSGKRCLAISQQSAGISSSGNL